MIWIILALGITGTASCPIPGQTELHGFIREAARLSDYPYPKAVEYGIRLVEQDGQWFAQFYNGAEAAIYWPGMIVLNCDKLTTYPQVYIDSVFVHEAVHHLQFLNGEMTDTRCRTLQKLEQEAYQIQSSYLVAHGEPAVTGPAMRCSWRSK